MYAIRSYYAHEGVGAGAAFQGIAALTTHEDVVAGITRGVVLELARTMYPVASYNFV